jgi:surface protein
LTAVPSSIPSTVTNMAYMFFFANTFNGDISGWNTSNVTYMGSMFSNAYIFNQNIGNWNTSAVTNMSYMFENAPAFNQNIGNWNTSAVTNMTHMFYGALAFNQNIGNWNTSAVTNMSYMFYNARAFNQNIGGWNTSAVTNMSYMFSGAVAFNQNIGGWNVTQVTNMTNFLTGNSAMSIANFDSLLNGWATQNVKSGVTLTAPALKYSSAGQTAYTTLTNKGWTINSAGINAVAPSITFAPITKTYGDAAFTPAISSNSSGAFTYSSSDPTVATGGSIITIVGAGSATITATQAANGSYLQGTATATLTVNRNAGFRIVYPSMMEFLTNQYTRYKPSRYGNIDKSVTYRTSKPMPPGIKFKKSNGEIYGTPLIPFGEFTFTVFTDAYGYESNVQQVTLFCIE